MSDQDADDLDTSVDIPEDYTGDPDDYVHQISVESSAMEDEPQQPAQPPRGLSVLSCIKGASLVQFPV